VQRDGVRDSAHAELTDAEARVAALVGPLRKSPVHFVRVVLDGARSAEPMSSGSVLAMAFRQSCECMVRTTRRIIKQARPARPPPWRAAPRVRRHGAQGEADGGGKLKPDSKRQMKVPATRACSSLPEPG